MRALFQSPAQKNTPHLNNTQTPATLTTKDLILKTTTATITTTPTTSNKISNSDFNNLIKIKDDDEKYLQEIVVPFEKKTVIFMDMESLDDPHFEDSEEDDNDDSEDDDDQYYGTPPEESNFIDMKSRFKSEPNLSKILQETVKFETPKKFTSKLIKGVSMVNLRLPFSTEKKLVQKSKSVLIKSTKRNYFKENILESPTRELFPSNLDCLENTPNTFRGRNSMSPISKSTQRMPKSMQVNCFLFSYMHVSFYSFIYNFCLVICLKFFNVCLICMSIIAFVRSCKYY